MLSVFQLMRNKNLLFSQSMGLFYIPPFTLRALEKLNGLIDYEMRRIGAQKVTLPCLSHINLWKKSSTFYPVISWSIIYILLSGIKTLDWHKKFLSCFFFFKTFVKWFLSSAQFSIVCFMCLCIEMLQRFVFLKCVHISPQWFFCADRVDEVGKELFKLTGNGGMHYCLSPVSDCC